MSTATNTDFTIHNLEQYIGEKSIIASRLIWLGLLDGDKDASFATFRPNLQCDNRREDSQIVNHLKSAGVDTDKRGG